MVETRDAVEIYPALPRPATVDTKELLRKEVDTKLAKLGVETTPEIEEM